MTSKQSSADYDYKPFERSEKVLNSDVEPFHRKAASLVDLWKQLSCVGASPRIQCIIHLMDWAKLHTLNIVLSGEWRKHKEFFENKLLQEVKNCDKELFKLNNSFSLHCKKLMKVIRDPWGNATLHRLLNAQDTVIGKEEFEFFISESGYLVSMRLKKLCESHCEDLALNLVTAYMRCCEWADSQNMNMSLTGDQKRFMLDVYVALLYKYNKTTVILSTLKSLSLRHGLELVQRFAKKRVSISKLWKHSKRITHLALVLFCSTAVMQPIEQTGEILSSLIDVWLTLCDRDENLESLILSIRKVVQVTVSAPHMYIFCQALNKKFGPRIKTFNIELYVQALTTDLNLLERQKNEDDRDNLQETSKRLADGLLQLAEVLEDHVNVCRECVLTSFSLQPTKEGLRRIEDLARRCGYEVLDTGQWKCKLHPPISSEDDLGLQCFHCGDFMGQMQLEAALNTNTALSEALTADRLGVSPELCDDLAVLVCSPRYQLLSWLQKWQDLHRLCVMYLNDPERTKNLVTELKFLEIDYSIFMNIKREPEDEDDNYGSNTYTEGIDLDYSEFDEPPKPKRKRGRKKKVRDDAESDFLPFAAPKSDPEVLKTLRSFRRTFKRKSDSDSSSPGKVFVGDNNVHSDYSSYAQTYGANSNFDGYNVVDNCHYSGFNDYNTPYVNKYDNFVSNTSRTFNEIAFRAHEEVLQREGLYPQHTYYDRQGSYYQNQRDPYKYSAQGPSTSRGGGFKESEENFNSVTDLSKNIFLSDTLNKKDKAPDEQLEIEEQHFSLNEFTNEITIQDTSDSLYDESENILPILARFASTEVLARALAATKNMKTDALATKTDAGNFIFPSYKSFNKSSPQKNAETFASKDNSADDLLLVKDYTMKTLQKLHGSEMPSVSDVDTLVKTKLPSKNAATKQRTYKAKATVDAVTKRLALKLKDSADPRSSNDTLRVKELNDDASANVSFKTTAKDAPANQDKSLFREKFIETVFADENRKALKEFVKESLNKKNEGSCNKENSRFVAKKKINKSEKPADMMKAVHVDKVSPKLNINNNKKCDAGTLERSTKEYVDKLSPKAKNTLIKSKEKLSIQDAFQESLKKYDGKFHCLKNDRDATGGGKRNYDGDCFNGPSVSDVTHNKNSCQEQSVIDYARKFNLKDLRVILHRLNVKFPVKKGDVSKSKSLNDKKLSKKAHKHKIKKDERRAADTSVQLSDGNRTDKTLRVIINDSDIIKPNILADYLKSETEKLKEETSKLNPRVVLKRLEFDRVRYVNSILANVPGLNDTELIRPGVVDSVVQVVQIAGGRQNSTVSANTQTSTQVTPHIQRIGQPRNDKPETTAESSSPTLKTTTTTNSKPATSQPSTLISMLSPQIKPGQSNNTTRNRTAPLINILSQQIIKPANTTVSTSKSTSTTTTTEAQSNSTPKIVAGEQQQIINQIMGPVRTSVPSLKLGASSESSRIVQFICQSSDGKLIPVTSFTPNRVVKVATTQTVTSSSSSPGSPSYDENYTKLIQTTPPKTKSDVAENSSETLPKFQQAFDTPSEKTFSYHRKQPLITTPIATPVIAQATCCSKEEITTIDQAQGTQTIMTLSLNTVDRNKGDSGKAEERVQSVLVTAGTSSGPMLSHSPPQYKQSDCSGTTARQTKDDKKNQNESKNYQGNVYALQGKVKKAQAGSQKLDRELQQLSLQRKQAALERELRLQKSLSEECEDLGVDEPSTSDLFPEADLLFDSNHSPSFDQISQDVIKRSIHLQEGKEEAKLTLFSDDDFLFESREYQTAEKELEYEEEQSRLLTNGQGCNSRESESPCEDNTLLQTCTSMSDVTLNSPISPDVYNTNTPPPVNKYVHKYSNKKKNERTVQVENWTAEVSSSEDTTGSTELVKSSSRSPELCLSKRSDEELSDGGFKVVHVAISKTECGELHCTGGGDCSLGGRGARKSVKKLCSCCNGSQDEAANRKRPASQPHTPTPHKKTFPNKKR